ncbi:MAG: hypothetical protein RIQ56_1010 [Candidatus Parcubacteria bacterium]
MALTYYADHVPCPLSESSGLLQNFEKPVPFAGEDGVAAFCAWPIPVEGGAVDKAHNQSASLVRRLYQNVERFTNLFAERCAHKENAHLLVAQLNCRERVGGIKLQLRG